MPCKNFREKNCYDIQSCEIGKAEIDGAENNAAIDIWILTANASHITSAVVPPNDLQKP